MIWALVIGAWHIPPVRLERVQRRRCAPSPADWPERPWYELALDFARGEYGLIVDSDHYVAYFEDTVSSDLVGEIGYAPPPLDD